MANLHPTRGKIVLFGTGGSDKKYLDFWQNVPLRYTPGQPTDSTWNSDAYEEVIANDPTGERFERAADLLLRYEFYPPNIMSHVSHFSLQDRRMRVGERLVQRIHVISLVGIPIVDVLTMNEIYAVIDEPRCKGFTYITTAAHSEVGEWSAEVEWRENGDLVLRVHAISRPFRDTNRLMLAFIRRLQKRAHHDGIAHFKQSALG